MIKSKKLEWFVLAGLLLISLVPVVGGVLRLIEMGSGLTFLPDNPRIQLEPIPVIFHIVASFIYCVIGAFQFLPSIRNKYIKRHRLAGRVIVCAGVISALSGLWMTQFYTFPSELQGTLLFFVRINVGFAMITFLLLGLTAILKKRIAAHRAWMIRAYSLGQGAGMQVLVSLPWILAAGEPTGLTRDVLMTLAWVINVTIAEWAIYIQHRQRTKTRQEQYQSFSESNSEVTIPFKPQEIHE